MKSNASLLKKLTIGLLFVGATSVSMMSQAAVTLLVDDHIKVTAINGQELTSSLFQQETKSFTLQPGQHVITAKYDRLYDLGRDEHDYLRSSNISVAAQMADNQTYRLTMPNQPEDYKAAKEYAKKPTLAVQQGNAIIASQQSVGNSGSSIFSGLGKALGGVFGGGDDAELQNQQAIAALGNKTTISTTSSVKPYSAPVAQPTNTLDSFMHIWLQATPAEREKMRQWIQQ
jgi:hypothetical protein